MVLRMRKKGREYAEKIRMVCSKVTSAEHCHPTTVLQLAKLEQGLGRSDIACEYHGCIASISSIYYFATFKLRKRRSCVLDALRLFPASCWTAERQRFPS